MAKVPMSEGINHEIKRSLKNQTYAKQVNEIAIAFNSLPEEQRARCVLSWGGAFFQRTGSSRFSTIYCNSSGTVSMYNAVLSITESNCHFLKSQNFTAPLQDLASDTDTESDMILYCY